MKKSIKASEKKVLKKLKKGPKSVDELRDYLSCVRNINRGGCGIAALAIYDQAKREGKNPKIVFCWDVWSLMWCDDNGPQQHEAYKNGKRKTAVSCSHVLVKIGRRYYDCKENATKSEVYDEFRIVDEEVSRDHLVAAVNNKGQWNSEFDRKVHLPKIEKYLGYKLLSK